jgi:menaquinone-dependent protoporphyrinogen oxidase
VTVLVAAASKYGATAEIAEAIGRALRDSGVAADVRPVEQAGDLSGYTGVVLGSAVYVGRWLEPARRFVTPNAVPRRPLARIRASARRQGQSRPLLLPDERVGAAGPSGGR